MAGRSTSSTGASRASPRTAPRARRRQEQVAKVLAVEAGIVDGATVQWVTNSIPTIDLRRESTDREIAELADLLRGQLR